MGWNWVGVTAVSVAMALGAVQPVAATPSSVACDQWKDRLKAEAAKTRLLPPIGFERTEKVTFEISGMDDIDLIADCKDGLITSLNGTIRGTGEVTATRWLAFSRALAKSFDPTLSTDQIEKRIKTMSLNARKELVRAKARGESNARGTGLQEFGGYQMSFDVQDGYVGMSARPIEDDE